MGIYSLDSRINYELIVNIGVSVYKPVTLPYLPLTVYTMYKVDTVVHCNRSMFATDHV